MRENLIAPLSIACGMMVLAISDNLIAVVADAMSLWQYHVLRALMMLPVMALAMVLLGQGGRLRVARPGAVAVRTALNVSGLMLYFSAIPATGISLAAAGMFTSPIFVLIVSVMFFGERAGWRRVTGVALGFLGVCLVLEVATQPLRAMAVVPILGGFLYGLSVIWTRQYCRHESPGALGFWGMAAFLCVGLAGLAATPWLGGLIGHVEGTEFATMPWHDPGWEEIGLVAIMGAGGAIGMVLLANGYRGGQSSQVALFDYSFLVWVPLFAWVLHSEVVSMPVASGMVLIVAAGVLALWDAPRPEAAARGGLDRTAGAD